MRSWLQRTLHQILFIFRLALFPKQTDQIWCRTLWSHKRLHSTFSPYAAETSNRLWCVKLIEFPFTLSNIHYQWGSSRVCKCISVCAAWLLVWCRCYLEKCCCSVTICRSPCWDFTLSLLSTPRCCLFCSWGLLLWISLGGVAAGETSKHS